MKQTGSTEPIASVMGQALGQDDHRWQAFAAAIGQAWPGQPGPDSTQPGPDRSPDRFLVFDPDQLFVFAAIDSTNRALWQRSQGSQTVDSGCDRPPTLRPGAIAIALEQTAGRGQWGRTWQSAPGGLYLSLYIEPDLAPQNAAQLTLAAAWGVATSLGDRGVAVQVKWPNDLLLSGRKLGGILTETRLSQGKIRRAVIGLGLNWQNPTPDTGITLATDPACPFTSLPDLAGAAIAGLVRGDQQLSQGGITSFLADYLALLADRGRELTITNAIGEPTTGFVVGVTAQGELRLAIDAPDQTQGDRGGDRSELHFPPGTISLGYLNSLDKGTD